MGSIERLREHQATLAINTSRIPGEIFHFLSETGPLEGRFHREPIDVVTAV